MTDHSPLWWTVTEDFLPQQDELNRLLPLSEIVGVCGGLEATALHVVSGAWVCSVLLSNQ